MKLPNCSENIINFPYKQPQLLWSRMPRCTEKKIAELNISHTLSCAVECYQSQHPVQKCKHGAFAIKTTCSYISVALNKCSVWPAERLKRRAPSTQTCTIVSSMHRCQSPRCQKLLCVKTLLRNSLGTAVNVCSRQVKFTFILLLSQQKLGVLADDCSSAITWNWKWWNFEEDRKRKENHTAQFITSLPIKCHFWPYFCVPAF